MMAKKKTARSENVLVDVPVRFGNVSIGDGSASVSVSIDRDDMNPAAADNLLCARRLTAVIAVGGDSDDADQQLLFDDMRHKIETVFEVKGYSVKAKEVRATFNMLLKDVKITILGKFAKHRGRLVVFQAALIEDNVDEPNGEE